MRKKPLNNTKFYFALASWRFTKSIAELIVFMLYIIMFKHQKISNSINNSRIVFIFSLSQAQIKSFKLLIQDKRFEYDFSIPLISNSNLIILHSQKNFYKEYNKKIIIGISSMNTLMMYFLKFILKIRLRNILNNKLAERLNFLAIKSDLSVFVTNSVLGQDLFGLNQLENKNFKTHCAHYSENSLPIKIGIDSICQSRLNEPEWLAKEPSDYQWVWSEGYAEYIRKINPKTKVNVVGFVSFDHLPSKPTFEITLFDITPVKPGYIENIYPLYELNASIKFVSDIVKIIDTIQTESNYLTIKLRIKPKRRFEKIHSTEYITFLENLQREGKVIITNHATNPYDIVSKSDLVIGTPFTTAVQIGTNLGIPSVYYNYIEEKIYYAIEPTVQLIENYQELFKYVYRLFKIKLYNLRD